MSEPNNAVPPPGGKSPRLRFALAPLAVAAALGAALEAPPARAAEFSAGAVRGNLDTTISQGLTLRVEERDETLAAATNSNDGNLNYERGIVSSTSKFTSDLDLRAGRVGAFVRATGFLDYENRDGKRERTELNAQAKERVGRDVGVLDAFVTAPVEFDDKAVDFRLGKHVLNWGESTFIPNGISVVNPFDVSKLRLPGAELREALLPVWMISAEAELSDTLSVAGFHQFVWEETHIDPVGTYFSSTDYVGPGAREAVIANFTAGRDDGHGFGPLAAAIDLDLAGLGQANPAAAALGAAAPISSDPDFASVLRGPDRTPRNAGQWGLAVRYYAEELYRTEFGLYFVNYHSRLPTVSADAASAASMSAGLAAAGAVSGASSRTVAALTQQVTQEVQAAVQAGQIPAAGAQQAIQAGVASAVQGVAAAVAVDRFAKGGSYFLEYPEDLQLLGVSFNTVLGATGWALQGEYSLRPNAPLQRAERTVLAEGLAPVFAALQLSQNPQALGQFLAAYQPPRIDGYVERQVSQVQATATRVFGPMAGADAVILVGEAALMHVHDMPDEPLESPAGGVRSASNVADTDADASSWGYRLAARLDYNNVIDAIHLYPYAQFLHDVSGNSPAPSGPFVEGRTALTVGVQAAYLSRWQADISYTRIAGEGSDLSDRDFVSLSVKYSF